MSDAPHRPDDRDHDADPASPDLSPAAPPDESGAWRRLDRRMLLVTPVQAVVRFLPALVVLVVAGSTRDSAPWWTNLAPVVFPIAYGLLVYGTTTYRITDTQLQLRRGLLQRATLTARLDRIRTVDVTASLLHRLLGVAGVKVGTAGEQAFELDGLPAADAAQLRTRLLHAARTVPQEGSALPAPMESPAAPSAAPESSSAAPESPLRSPQVLPLESSQEESPEVELAALSPRWIAYAPFSLTGIAGVVVAAGAVVQFLGDLTRRALESELGSAAREHVRALPLWLVVLESAVGLLVLATVASVISYVLRYWGYRLTRHAGGTLAVTRGLLTTRVTSLEERRLRGVVLTRGALLAAVGGAKGSALVTGAGEAGSDLLVPAAPRARVVEVLDAVLREPAVLAAPLRRHGPVARRRRHVRAWVTALVLGAVSVAAILWWQWPLWLYAVPVALVATAPLLGRARYARLGHAFVAGHVVSRHGLAPERTWCVGAGGIIGWNVSASVFQRRVGLVTLTATLAAGGNRVDIPDIPAAEAVALMRAATPGLVDGFVAGAG